MNKHRFSGFTLIELLVVIAIIGILSAVVLASLSTARSKGDDAAIQSDMASAQTEAEIYYGTTGANSYGTLAFTSGTNCSAAASGSLFNDSTIQKALTSAWGDSSNTAANLVCVAANTTYAIGVKLTATASTWWCVDSTGTAKQESGSLPTASFSC